MGEALRPDIVLMDLNLPGISGVEATRRLTAVDSGPRVLALTMVDDDETVLAALRAGAAATYSRARAVRRSPQPRAPQPAAARSSALASRRASWLRPPAASLPRGTAR